MAWEEVTELCHECYWRFRGKARPPSAFTASAGPRGDCAPWSSRLPLCSCQLQWGQLLKGPACLCVYPGDCRMAHAEQKLMDDALNKTRYNNLIRPTTSSSQLISIETELSLAQCISW